MRRSEDDMKGAEAALLKVMTRHVGRTRAIGMGELFSKTFNQPWSNKVNDTRIVRELVTRLRKSGVPILSATDSGYYLASAGSELNSYCDKLAASALKKLFMVSQLKKTTLPALLGQMDLDFGEKQNG